jgi:hypothetical protein
MLALWKRVIAKRNQATSEAEGLQQTTKKLKLSLVTYEQEASLLRNRLDVEAAARADAEQQLRELQAKHIELGEAHRKRHQVSCCHSMAYYANSMSGCADAI